MKEYFLEFFVWIFFLLSYILIFYVQFDLFPLIILSFPIIFFIFYLYYNKKIKKLLIYKDVYQIISQLFRYTEFNSFLDNAVHLISEILNSERSTIFLLNPQTNLLLTVVAEGFEIKEIILSINEGIAGYVARTKEVVRIEDAYKDSRFSPIFDQKTGFKTKSVLCAPIIERTKGSVIGVIEVLNKKTKKNFTKEDEEVLKIFCNEISNIVVNTQLYTQLRNLLESLLKAFATAVDARDPATKGHSIRVMRYALRIGKEMKLSMNELKILEYASILHDVGKIGIPDSVLLKPDRFTKEEYEIMKKHVVITKEIISAINFPPEYKDVPIIATMHHEFLDGSGYPNGLKGEQIPLLARILCIADIYDALVSYDRPYKPAYSKQEAVNILYEMAKVGKIDREILDIFVSKELYKIEQRKFLRLNDEISLYWKQLTPEEIKSLLPTFSKTTTAFGGGLQFVYDESLPVNDFLEMDIHLSGSTITTIAKIVDCYRIDNKYKISVSFMNISKETQEKLNNILKRSYN